MTTLSINPYSDPTFAVFLTIAMYVTKYFFSHFDLADNFLEG